MSRPALIPNLIVAALAATIAFHPGLEAKAAESRTIVIEIRGFAFLPESPAVRPGDVVVLKNMDIVPHTATAKDESWDSGSIAAGGEWVMTVTDELIEGYFCRFHPSMVAALEIEPE